jgi:hypothetical protein
MTGLVSAPTSTSNLNIGKMPLEDSIIYQPFGVGRELPSSTESMPDLD